MFDEYGRPLLLSVRVLKSTWADGLELEAGAVMRIALSSALRLIRLGYCERKNPRKSSSKRRRERAAKLLREAEHARKTQVT
jgi:hypothetical protein